jgi:hypothetical protein
VPGVSPYGRSVGSGLILLVIVGAWLAVLVPMALKSHDTTASLKSADRFSDAMQVLSGRKSSAGRRDVVMPRRAPAPPVLSAPRHAPARPAPATPERRPGVTQAERRRRTALVLLGLALLTLGLGMLGARLLLVTHVLTDLLLVGFLVHCRRQAVLRAQRRVRGLARDSAPATARAPRLTGIPDRMPARPAPVAMPAPAPAARYDDAATGTEGIGGAWDPVPVPPPTYVGKPVAPPRRQRVLDLTKPGEWTAALEADDAGLDIFDDEGGLEEILERRRAVNDW